MKLVPPSMVTLTRIRDRLDRGPLGLPGTDEQTLSEAAATLEEHGFTVESDAEDKSLRGRKGNVRVIMSSAFPDDDQGFPSLNVQMNSAEAISDDFAEAAPAEDYSPTWSDATHTATGARPGLA